MQKRNKREKAKKKKKENAVCDGSLLLFLLIPNCCALKNTKCVGKKIDKKIFFDILIKVGLKSREKSEKTRYYFVLLSE